MNKKRIFRVMGVIMTLAVLISSMPGLSAAYAGEGERTAVELPYAEDFSAITDVDGLISAGWIDKDGMYTDDQAPKYTFEDGRLNAKAGANLAVRLLDNPTGDEVLRISYDMNSNTADWVQLGTYLRPDGAVDGNDSIMLAGNYYYNLYIGSFDNSSKLSGGIKGKTISYIHEVDYRNKTIKTVASIEGALVGGTVTGFMHKDGKTEVTELPKDFVINSWGGNFWVDNIKVDYAENCAPMPTLPGTIPLSDGFDYESLAGMDSSGWKQGVSGKTRESLSDSVAAIDTETFKNDPKHGNTVQIKEGQKINYLFNEAQTRVTVKFDFYQSGDADTFRLNYSKNGKEEGNNNVVGVGKIGYGQGSTATEGQMIINAENWGAGNHVLPMKRALDTWYTYEVDFVMSADRASCFLNVKIYNDGKLTGNYRNIKFASWTHTDSVKQISLEMLGGSGESTWFDNVEVYATDTAPKLENYYIYSEDFDGKTAEDMVRDGWDGDISKLSLANGAIEYTGAATLKKKILSSSNQSDKIRVSYDITVKNWQDTLSAVNLISGSDTLTLGGYYYLAQVGGISSANDGAVQLPGMTLNELHHIDHVVDLAAKTITTTMTKPDGSTVTVVKEGFKKRNTSSDITGALDTLAVEMWGDNAVIDNLAVEYYYGKPSVTDAGIVFKSADGSVIEKSAEIATDVKMVEINLSAEVLQESADNEITVTSGNTAADYTVAVNGDTAVITFDSALTPNTEYTLSIGAELCTELGFTLGRNYTYTFTTGAAAVKAKSEGIYSGTERAGSLSALTPGGKATVRVITANSTAEPSAITVIAAYFNGDMLACAVPYSGNLNAGAIGIYEQEIDVPDNMTDITRAEIYVWNSVTGMKPYCEVLELPR